MTKTLRSLRATKKKGETKQLADEVENELPSNDIKGHNKWDLRSN